MHILVVEDDERIATNIKTLLMAEKFKVTAAHDAEEGLYLATEESFDLIILDWMLPDGNGIEICKKLRSKHNATPILMLTSRSQLDDKVEGFTVGADDYLTKPFAKEELIARIKALIRRTTASKGTPVIQIADFSINIDTTEVRRKNKIISLAPKEYALLEYLVLHKCKVIDRMSLLHHVWDEDIDDFSNTVDVHIRYLRKKIDEGFDKPLIKTVKNKGYMLCET